MFLCEAQWWKGRGRERESWYLSQEHRNSTLCYTDCLHHLIHYLKYILWYSPPRLRTENFLCRKSETPNEGQRSGDVCLRWSSPPQPCLSQVWLAQVNIDQGHPDGIFMQLRQTNKNTCKQSLGRWQRRRDGTKRVGGSMWENGCGLGRGC